MKRVSKRMKAWKALLQDDVVSYDVVKAFDLLKSGPACRFSESVDLSINLGVDARKSDQAVRGSTVLPNGSGKSVRVAVFTAEDRVDEAKKAGADVAGFDDLFDTIKSGTLDFDVLIATPDVMAKVGQLGKILGPRGLMPNPKIGTVTANIAQAVSEVKSGKASYRIDKAGIIHCSIGSIAFDGEALIGNLKSVVDDVKQLRPASTKGTYIKRIFVSTTMGPALQIDASTL